MVAPPDGSAGVFRAPRKRVFLNADGADGPVRPDSFPREDV